jgi:hypothetical protein
MVLTAETLVSAYPFGIVALDCRACSREFRCLKWLLVGVCGADLTLAQLRERFTVDCPRRHDPGTCAMRFSDLEFPPGPPLNPAAR